MKSILKVFVICFVISIVIISSAVHSEYKRNNVMISVLDVQLGESILLQLPSRHTIIIDGGIDATLLYSLSQQLPFYVKEIDLLILTHPDADHLNGLIDVLERYRVKKVILPTKENNTFVYNKFRTLVAQSSTELLFAEYISTIAVSNEYRLEILHPTIENIGKYDSVNNASIVIRLDYPQGCALFTGDIDISVEKEILSEGKNIKCELLKVAHHGSKTSSLQEFLDEVQPKMALISAGHNNKFGHPHQEVVKRLEYVGAKILNNTDVGSFTVTIKRDGTLEVE